jgi:hypothetical protein
VSNIADTLVASKPFHLSTPVISSLLYQVKARLETCVFARNVTLCLASRNRDAFIRLGRKRLRRISQWQQ